MLCNYSSAFCCACTSEDPESEANRNLRVIFPGACPGIRVSRVLGTLGDIPVIDNRNIFVIFVSNSHYRIQQSQDPALKRYKMKKKSVSFLLAMTIFLSVSCSKKKDNSSVPAGKKKYAWVSGYRDSTGYGMILFSADGGETFARQGQGSPALQGVDLSDIWAVDENTVWAVGSDNVILKTTDGGQTWSRVQAPSGLSVPQLMSVCVVDKKKIWISGSNGTVYKSPDDGITWTRFDTNFFHSGGMQGNWAITPQKVYVVGGIGTSQVRGFIGYTNDGGATWDTVFPAGDYNRNEWISVAASGNTIVVYGCKSHYMVSTDGGTTWENDSVPMGGGGGAADINHLIMLSPQIWWGAMDMGHVILTRDGGKTWSDQSTGQGGAFLLGIDAWDDQLALAVGEIAGWPEMGPVVKTSNGGIVWELKTTCRAFLTKVTFIKN